MIAPDAAMVQRFSVPAWGPAPPRASPGRAPAGPRTGWPGYLLAVAVLAAVYFAAGKLGLLFAVGHPSATAVWPPTGIALAALLVLGYRVWPGILAGAFLVNLLTAGSVATSLGIAAGNTLEGLLGAYLVNRFANGRQAFDRPQDVVKLAALAGVAGTVSATVGVTALCLGGLAPWAGYPSIWGTWWLGDTVGAVLVTPVLVLGSADRALGWDRGRPDETVLLVLAVAAVGVAVFAGPFRQGPLGFLCIPVLMWAGFRFGRREVAGAALALSGIAVWGTLRGFGPFVGASPNESLLLLQAFMGVLTVPALALTAGESQRRRAEESLRQSEASLRVALEAGHMGTWDWDIRTGEVVWSAGLEAIHGLAPGGFGGTFADYLRDVHPEDREFVSRSVAKAVERRQEHHVEYRIVWPDGSVRWVEGRGHLVCDGAGVAVRMLGVCTDVTERRRAEESLQRSYDLLRAVTEGTTDAVFVKDLRGRYRMINSAGARLLGKSVEEVLGKDDTELFSPDSAEPIRERDRRVLAAGEVQTYEEVGTAAGVTRTYLSTKGPYRDRRGEVIGLIGISRDITERKQAERRWAAEHAVTRILAGSPGLDEAAPAILGAICEGLGWDVGVLWRLDRQAGVLRCVRVWHAPQVEVSAFEGACRRQIFAAGAGLPGRIWAGGGPVWVPDVSREGLLPRGPIAAREGLHAAFGFPIRHGDEFLGVMEFFSREIRQPDEDLLQMLGSIGSQLSQFIERRQAEQVLHERGREFALARKIQRGALPRATPVLAGFEIAGASDPAQETGGDYFDFLPLPDGSLGIALGDASGHGIGAALLVAETCAYIRALALAHTDVDVILTLANTRLAEDTSDDHFVTLLLARLDPRTGSLVYSNAGHLPAHVLDGQGKVKAVLPSTGVPLGVEPAADFPRGAALTLGPGDLLLLLSDGVVETVSPGGTLFGVGRALELVRAHRHQAPLQIAEALLHTANDFAGNAQIDDRTAVILKVGCAS